MESKSKRITASIALFLAFCVTQVYVGVTFADSKATAPRANSGVAPQQATGVLTTQGNKAIMVNGASAISGGTIVSGASIETPDGVSATVNLPGLGSLQIEPGTKLVLEFQSGSVKVTLTQGCVTLHTKKGVTGEVDSQKGGSGKTDPAKDSVFKACPDRPGKAVVAAAGAGGLFGLGTAATVALVAGSAALVAVPLATRGRNPSPATP